MITDTIEGIDMTIRAKFRVDNIVPQQDDHTTIYLNAVYSTDPNNPNKAFTDATPSAQLSIVIKNDKPALKEFVMGKSYFVDFTPAE